jgi:NAD(P)-dependent dehydrogenase (short-subunit alcohol dehydrogenase family)
MAPPKRQEVEMTGRVEGQKAVVTGSGGAMGAAIAVRLAEEGADIALNDRLADLTSETEKTIRDLGRDVVSVVANVTRREGAERLVSTATDRWGRIDILVNVVGGVRPPVVNPIWSISEDDWEFAMGINLRGTFHCTQLVCTGMMERRWGKIVNIASNSWAGEAMHAHYSAAKAGVVALTRSVATQLAPFNINVNAVAPGGTRRSTRIAAQMDVPAASTHESVPFPFPFPSVADTGPLGRTNEPADIANAVLFLACQDSRNISGQLITVAGGNNPSL